MAVDRLRWGIYAFLYRWNCETFPGSEAFLVHMSRTFNSQADWLANRVLDLQCAEISGMNLCVPFNPGSRILIFSDGASRGNPGLFSAAAVVQILTPNNQLVVLAWRSISLGVSTSVHAEFESAILAQRLFVELCQAISWVSH